MGYNMDMSRENQNVVLPAGWRDFKIASCQEETSKAGNQMFRFGFLDIATDQETEQLVTAIQGKRWFLKQILNACNVEAGKDFIYNWDISDVLGKFIKGKVEQYDDTFTNRDNAEVTVTKSRIIQIKSMMANEETAIDKGEGLKSPFDPTPGKDNIGQELPF